MATLFVVPAVFYPSIQMFGQATIRETIVNSVPMGLVPTNLNSTVATLTQYLSFFYIKLIACSDLLLENILCDL